MCHPSWYFLFRLNGDFELRAIVEISLLKLSSICSHICLITFFVSFICCSHKFFSFLRIHRSFKWLSLHFLWSLLSNFHFQLIFVMFFYAWRTFFFIFRVICAKTPRDNSPGENCFCAQRCKGKLWKSFLTRLKISWLLYDGCWSLN